MMKRDLYWDCLKFVLIFFVVYGHIVPNYSDGSRFNMAMFNLIYMFHMPLFIFVSGRFSHIHNKNRYKKGIIRLLETYLVFQIIRSTITIARGGELTLEYLYMPGFTLWYLLSLMYWRLLIYCIPESWLLYRKYIILSSIVIGLLAGFIPTENAFAIQRTLSFLPFFILGYYSVDIDIRKYINTVPSFVSICVLISTFCILFFVFNKNLASFHQCRIPYWTDNPGQTFLRFCERCIFYPSAFVICIMVLRLVPTNASLAKWGGCTMFIFIYHSFALREFLFPLIKFGFIPKNEFLLLIYAIIITFGLLFFSKNKFLNILLNPITNVRNNLQKS